MIKVLVFGVFDGLHAGHKFFLREAKKLGGYLIVVVAKDEIVKKIKNKNTRQKFIKRKTLLEKESYVNEVIAGDSKPGSWKIFQNLKPDVIALGYDQLGLKKSLEEYLTKANWTPTIKIIRPFEPQKYKSSLIKS